jgi:hypothetical protein
MIDELDELQSVAPDDEKNLTKGQRIEKWLRDKFEFRYNEVKNVSEYRPTGKKQWQGIDDYFLNSVKRELRDTWYWDIQGTDKETGEPKKKKEYLRTSVAELQQTIESEFSPKVDVIKSYLRSLPHQNYSGNAIESLANTVQLASWYTEKQREYWPTYLKKWLVGTVANVLEDHNCKNHICLVLVGNQGLRKGFWIEHLVQDAIGPQYIRTDGDFSPHRKDCIAAIGTYWVIHLDDMLKRINLRDYNEIKNAITTPDVKVRLPYARKDSVLPHRASFIATVNDREFLTDTTGARRFMPFELEKIDYEAYEAIDKNDVWSEAMQIYMQGSFDYWIDTEEEKELQAYKEQFAVEFTEEGLLLQYFRPFMEGIDWMDEIPEGQPGKGGKQGRWMQATEILGAMMEKAGVFRNLSDKKLGGLLKKNGFVKKSRYRAGNSVKCYKVVELDHEEKTSDSKQNFQLKPATAPQTNGYDIDQEPDVF